MYQKWRDLLFIHWMCEPEEIQKKLPPGLIVDTFEGRAYFGVIPFRMHSIRVKGLPPLPGLFRAVELNCRTYVRNHKNERGVYFFSLDITSKIMAFVAKTWAHLPYYYANMTFDKGVFSAGKDIYFEWVTNQKESHAAEGTLEHFLMERYRLYTFYADTLYFIDVSHKPYSLREAEITAMQQSLLARHQISSQSDAPAHVIFSPGVDVEIGLLKKNLSS